jgi:hypothetical protein
MSFQLVFVTWHNVFISISSTLCHTQPSPILSGSSFRVCTHQQSRVESNPVQSHSQRLGSDCGLLTMANAAVCTHQHSWVESSPTSLAESRVLMPHVLFSSVRLQWSGVTQETDVEKPILLVKEYKAIYDASHCEHHNLVLHWWRRCS